MMQKLPNSLYLGQASYVCSTVSVISSPASLQKFRNQGDLPASLNSLTHLRHIPVLQIGSEIMKIIINHQTEGRKELVSTLPMLRLLSSKARGRKGLLKPSKPCHVGIHWIALAEYSQMSTHMPGFQSFSGFLHLFVLVELATSSIRAVSDIQGSPTSLD